jgi:hypothetical protein
MPSAEDCGALQGYFEGVEKARQASETKWGCGRAEILASDDLRARFRRQQQTWATAYEAAWRADFLTRDLLDAVQQKAAAMQRGYAALDAYAEAEGHRPIQPWVWEVALADGTVAAFVQTVAEAGKVQADGRYVSVYTAAEVGHVIDALPVALRTAKAVWPGAKIQASRPIGNPLGAPPFDQAEGDEIPFGAAQEG